MTTCSRSPSAGCAQARSGSSCSPRPAPARSPSRRSTSRARPSTPVWISLRLDPGQQDAPPEPFTLVTFRAGDDYELSSPQRYPVTDADMAALAGVPVSRDRGEGYQPWPRPPEPDWRVAWTILLPRPRGMNRGCFTTAPSWWRRLARQVIPRRAPRDCCYYHRVDWHQVSAAAIRVTRQARLEGLAGLALGHRAAELAEDQDLPPQDKGAWSICSPGAPPYGPPGSSVATPATATAATASPRCSTAESAGPSSSADGGAEPFTQSHRNGSGRQHPPIQPAIARSRSIAGAPSASFHRAQALPR